jgi:disulfide oxidoreductase YuzD
VKAAEAIAASLGRIYGAEVEVLYYDVDDPAVATAHADSLEAFALDGAPLPVVILDGEILFAGAINPLHVVAAVAAGMTRHRV